MEMEKREDLNSILPFLPLLIRSSNLYWPSQAVEILRELASGRVDSVEHLLDAISHIRNALSLSSQFCSSSALHGYALFLNDVMSEEESKQFLNEVVPAFGNLLLRLPSLLEAHYENADRVIDGDGATVRTGLRILDSQEAGIVFLSQELIAALLACSVFCLFPVNDRSVRHLPLINFDGLFASMYDDYHENLAQKMLTFGALLLYLYANLSSGLIEDQTSGAVEVDFANKYLGGGALRRGCVQEEIRFMVSPELIAGMLFLPAMADNEAIEIVGVERFSSYTGYASSFKFNGDYVDKRDVDALGRWKTRIVAIDALCSPGMRQYSTNFLLREINKAFCGFLYQSNCQQYQKILQENGCSSVLSGAATLTSMETSEIKTSNHEIRNSQNDYDMMDQDNNNIGVATGNWGCGAFGGDPEVKTIIQWLAASQALRPFIAYYTFGLEALLNLDEVAHWILTQRWTIGDLWNMLIEYSTKRSKGETNVGFLRWLLPSIYSQGTGMDLAKRP
ncbi:poly(ADP-ribose) glycohydrolase 1-like isoform X4 [Abrus precatorius]|uniref:poly(ADP-ribose) glycohydrolase n=1 Tax=Abrus precatorius TaxID=3816 RepID=A0A8B8M263_ABRPR|nr:poly(ADP-ribose) glycohydrolase 1-like isoform X4 [Abrus precatorius]